MDEHFNVADMSYVEMGNILLPHISQDPSGNANGSGTGHEALETARPYQSSGNFDDQLFAGWIDGAIQTPGRASGRTPTRRGGIGLDYSPINIAKVDLMAHQLEAGIEPYIASGNLPIGAGGMLDERETLIYNSTPYDSLLYPAAAQSMSGVFYGEGYTNVPTVRPEDKENASWMTTPKKMGSGNANTPSTIVLSSAQQQHTVLRNSRQLNNSQTPIRAVKTSSFTRLIAEASDTSPAKGKFINRSVPPGVGSAVNTARSLVPSVPRGAGQSSSVGVNRPMSFSMSSFQVHLNNASNSLNRPSKVPQREGASVSKKKRTKPKKSKSIGSSTEANAKIMAMTELGGELKRHGSVNQEINQGINHRSNQAAVSSSPNQEEMQHRYTQEEQFVGLNPNTPPYLGYQRHQS